MCREDIPDADSDIIDEIAIALSTDSAMELPAEKQPEKNIGIVKSNHCATALCYALNPFRHH